MAGSLIISLDCEGKWGLADLLTRDHHRMFTDAALIQAYRSLVGLFDRYEISATFAFVMAFTLDENERRDFASSLDRPDDPWLAHFHACRSGDLKQGWFVPEALEIVRRSGRHEVACHSFCHRPLADKDIDLQGATAELEAAEAVARRKGIKLETFVYPRNEVGNVEALGALGYRGYRLARRGSRVAAIASELNLWTAPEPAAPAGTRNPMGIPAGYFFNARFGMRRGVPKWITVSRWERLLDRAARESRVAHLWLHPHNLISGPSTLETLRTVIAHAAAMRDRGLIEVRTQIGHCRAAQHAGGE
jgi:peptidoglycan/xylan/chitin deacetylase (PgdA/CDA1 family)